MNLHTFCKFSYCRIFLTYESKHGFSVFSGLSLDTVQKIKAGYKIFIMTVNKLGKLALKTQSGLRLDFNNGKLYSVHCI